MAAAGGGDVRRGKRRETCEGHAMASDDVPIDLGIAAHASVANSTLFAPWLLQLFYQHQRLEGLGYAWPDRAQSERPHKDPAYDGQEGPGARLLHKTDGVRCGSTAHPIRDPRSEQRGPDRLRGGGELLQPRKTRWGSGNEVFW